MAPHCTPCLGNLCDHGHFFRAFFKNPAAGIEDLIFPGFAALLHLLHIQGLHRMVWGSWGETSQSDCIPILDYEHMYSYANDDHIIIIIITIVIIITIIELTIQYYY